jgi:methyl-accepting chemotaxis protein
VKRWSESGIPLTAGFFFTFLLILVVTILTGIFVVLKINSLKGWGVALDYAGRLEFNSQGLTKHALLLYREACLARDQKFDKGEIKEKINKSKELVNNALSALRDGKEGSIRIDKAGDRALNLFTEIEKSYKELFALINEVELCSPDFEKRSHLLSEEILKKVEELTFLLAKKSEFEGYILKLFIFFASGIVIILIFANYFFSKRNLNNTIKEINQYLSSLEKGDFSKTPPTKIFTEFQFIIDQVNILKSTLENFLLGLRTQNVLIAETVKEEKGEVLHLSPISTQISNLISQAEVIGGELTDLISQIKKSTEEMKLAIDEISKSTHSTADRARMVRVAAEEMERTVLTLNQAMSEIREITNVIQGIAEQTNLLALNASIEAARAGEAGKGFAVVANEVKELARRVNENSSQIERIVERLSQNVEETVSKAEEVKRMVDETESATQTIAGAIEEQTAVTNDIVNYSIQTKEKAFQLVSEIESLKKAKDSLLRVSNSLKVGIEVLEEIALTSKISTEDLFIFEGKAISDEELKNFSVEALINLSIIGHIIWKMNFLSSAIKGKVPQVERDHRKCLLGKSISILKEKTKGTEIEKVLDVLEGPHERLHGLVSRFEKEVNLKNIDEILSFIEKEVLPTFQEVMKELLNIKNLCRKLGC